ncbi:MAG: imidazoleglycerol-phosphate dehydratase HisB [Crenarchaeota archaeon]|nr:imidazoleglycerol-phosphate dehydratase HisB [Thermoproteota archaeon]
MSRIGTVDRKTKETHVKVRVDLDGNGNITINTPLKFLNHMLETFGFYAHLDLEITAEELKECGEDHHLVEDVAICLGKAIDKALGDRSNISRFGWSIIPMDDALCLTSIDLGTRTYFRFDYKFRREKIGDISSENIVHFLYTLTMNMRATVHIKVLDGYNEHHICEAIFKSLGTSFHTASRVVERTLSVKGSL